MKALTFIVVVLILCPTFRAISFKCALFTNDGYFEFSSLTEASKKTENGVNQQYFLVKVDGNEKAYFHPCEKLIAICDNENFEDEILIQMDSPKCTKIAESNNDFEITGVYDSNQDQHYIRYFTSKDISETKTSYELIIICNSDKDDKSLEFNGKETPSENAKYIKAEGYAKAACPLFSLTSLYHKYGIAFGIGFILLGIAIAILGYKIFKVSLFLIVTLIVAFIVFNICFQIAAATITSQKNWLLWLLLAVSVIIGMIVGFVLVKIKKLDGIIIGGCFGGLCAFLIFNLFLTSSIPAWGFWVILVGAALVGAGAGFFCRGFIIIAGTSLTGSYLVIVGITFFIEGIPSFLDMYKMIENNTFEMPVLAYVLYGLAIGMTIAAIILQYKYKPIKGEEEEVDPNEAEARRILNQYKKIGK